MLYREFYVQMSSFRNPNTFDRELNFGSTAVRRYSISVNANTLDKLLSRLTEEVHIPEQEEEILRAVSIVGRNTGIGGQPVWCLNRNLSVDRDGWATKSSDFGLEWVSHLTEPGNGGEIADESLAARSGRRTYDSVLRCNDTLNGRFIGEESSTRYQFGDGCERVIRP